MIEEMKPVSGTLDMLFAVPEGTKWRKRQGKITFLNGRLKDAQIEGGPLPTHSYGESGISIRLHVFQNIWCTKDGKILGDIAEMHWNDGRLMTPAGGSPRLVAKGAEVIL